MYKKSRKSIVFIVCLIVLVSSFGYSMAKSIDSVNKNSNNSSIETMTIFRYGPDGSVTPIKVSLNLNKVDDLGEVLADKCNELFEKDTKMQMYLQNLLENTTLNLSFSFGLLYIKSHGRGLHFKTKTIVTIITRFKIFKIMLPHFKVHIKKHLIFCRYKNDARAKTVITPLIRSMSDPNVTKIIEGNHSVLVHNFVGYTTWCGHFSKSPFDILPRAFCGLARLVICNKLS